MKTIAAILILALSVLACDATQPSETLPVEAVPEAPSRLQVKSRLSISRRFDLTAICDTETGNLLYVYNGKNSDSLVVIQGGCE